MAEKETTIVYAPSKSLLFFSVIFFLLTMYLCVSILLNAPIGIFLVALIYVLFALWWLMTLATHTARFRVVISHEGIRIVRPTSMVFDSESLTCTWGEIQKVSAAYDKEFNPRYFTGRNMRLQLTLADQQIVNVDQIDTLENFTLLLANIQKFKPFAYELPKEHLLSKTKKRVVIASLAIVFNILILIYIL